ncbi:MAG: hypothetical protein K6F35_04410 [Lachnospiraceae bacterium]|nr:hypothetical protein [Lachnospiraceae bacterium]
MAACLRRPGEIDLSRLFITYVGLDRTELDEIRAEVEKRAEFKEIYFQKASPGVAVNMGAGAFGLMYCRKEAG